MAGGVSSRRGGQPDFGSPGSGTACPGLLLWSHSRQDFCFPHKTRAGEGGLGNLGKEVEQQGELILVQGILKYTREPSEAPNMRWALAVPLGVAIPGSVIPQTTQPALPVPRCVARIRTVFMETRTLEQSHTRISK